MDELSVNPFPHFKMGIRYILKVYFGCEKGLQKPPCTCAMEDLVTGNSLTLQASREVSLWWFSKYFPLLRENQPRRNQQLCFHMLQGQISTHLMPCHVLPAYSTSLVSKTLIRALFFKNTGGWGGGRGRICTNGLISSNATMNAWLGD